MRSSNRSQASNSGGQMHAHTTMVLRQDSDRPSSRQPKPAHRGSGQDMTLAHLPAHSTDVGALDAGNSLLQQSPRGGPHTETTALFAQETPPQTEVTCKLHGTIEAIKQTPSLATFRFRTVNRWQGGGLNQTTGGAGQEFLERDANSRFKPMNNHRYCSAKTKPPIPWSISFMHCFLHDHFRGLSRRSQRDSFGRRRIRVGRRTRLARFPAAGPKVRKGFKSITMNVRLTELSQQGTKTGSPGAGVSIFPGV
jgi:hypothetical protein